MKGCHVVNFFWWGGGGVGGGNNLLKVLKKRTSATQVDEYRDHQRQTARRPELILRKSTKSRMLLKLQPKIQLHQ